MTDVYVERIKALTDRRAEVLAERDAVAAQRAALIAEGKDTGGLFARVQGLSEELAMLDDELAALGNVAANRAAVDRFRSDRAAFGVANGALTAKREGLAQARADTLKAVAESADRLRVYVRELDEMGRAQVARATQLNAAAIALGEPADFTVPAEASVPVTGSRAAGIALSRVVQMARHGDRKALLTAIAEAAFVCSDQTTQCAN